ncbi:MAG TPA: hypothetical protein VHG51_07055 [Longimicrobiaceae bacterium]|nr:hypothetical protein [Longimicrobiaceae bacterium]
MAIFDRNYDRDYGSRGGSYRGEDRGLGDRMRQGWDRLTGDSGDQDRYGYRGGAYGATGYDRDLGSTGYGNYGAGSRQRPGYDRDTNWSAGRGAGMGMGGGASWNYDRDFDRGAGYGTYGARDMETGYDRDYKSRWQTDYGDPFGDRTNRTPIRLMRGEFHNREGYDVDYGRPYGAGSNVRYDRDMMDRGGMDRGGMDRDRGYMHGLNYDPYEDRNDPNAGRGWGANRNRGYDRGWF